MLVFLVSVEELFSENGWNWEYQVNILCLMEELPSQVSSIKKEMPQTGEKILAGILNSRGIFIPRRKIREALHEVDPIATSLRWAPRIERRPYSVPGVNALWHLGNSRILT